MSIHPVRILDWFGDPESPFYEDKEDMEDFIKGLMCSKCGKPVTFTWGYVMHSALFGGPDGAWCKESCAYG